jgi:hypothetical protein
MRSVAVLALAACAPKQRENFDVAEAPAAPEPPSPERAEGDALWEQRADRDPLAAALAKYEVAMSADARDRHVGERLTRGWYFLGDAYEIEDDARIAAWDDRLGQALPRINRRSRRCSQGGRADATAVRAATIRTCLPVLDHRALGRSSKLKDPPDARTRRDGEPTSAGRDHDPDFYYRAADRYWGVYYAPSSFAGRI